MMLKSQTSKVWKLHGLKKVQTAYLQSKWGAANIQSVQNWDYKFSPLLKLLQLSSADLGLQTLWVDLQIQSSQVLCPVEIHQ